MAVSWAPKTYMTNILDEKQFNLDFLWIFRVQMIQITKIEHTVLIQKVKILKMAPKLAIK